MSGEYPPEWVELIARTICLDDQRHMPGQIETMEQTGEAEEYRCNARAVLAVVAPLIVADTAQQIAAAIEKCERPGMRTAAIIARSFAVSPDPKKGTTE